MKKLILLLVPFLLSLPLRSAVTWTDELPLIEAKKETQKETDSKGAQISQEIKTSHSYVGDANVKVGNQIFGDTNQISNGVSYVVSPQITPSTLLRLGVQWDRNSYGLPATAKSATNTLPLPNTLQSTAAVIGADFTLNDDWIFRVEAQPGLYSDFYDISSEDVNVPFIFGASYLVSKDLQWFFGASVDLWRSIPVIPGLGARWKFADNWTLMFLLPKPRMEYELNDKLTLFVGADLRGATYRVEKDFGKDHARPGLNSAILDYTEVRAGVGATWKALSFLTMELEGGYVANRTFDYHRSDFRVRAEGAPYVQVAASASF